MLISKNGKKLMSFIIIMAFILSGIVYTPNTVNATDTNQPIVRVLGATLRLSQNKDNNGKQSMRIGVQISNASKAKDCAIEIKVEGSEKSYIIGTSNFPNATKISDSLNSIIENSDTVIYSAVITDIPTKAFDTQISIWGHAINMNDQDISSSVPENPKIKTVNGVISSLKEAYKDMNIEVVNGTLVTMHEKMQISENYLSDKDHTNNSSNEHFRYWGGSDSENAVYEITNENDTQYYRITTDTTIGKGLGYHFCGNGSDANKYLFIATIRATEEKNINIAYVNWFSNGFFPLESTEIMPINHEWQTISFTCRGGGWNADFFTTETKGDSYDIKSFNIYKILSSDDFNNYSDKLAPDIIPGIPFELITNGDFNDGLTGWGTDYNDNLISIVKENDNNYIKATGRWNQWSGIQQKIFNTIEDGDVCTISCDIYTEEENQQCHIYVFNDKDIEDYKFTSDIKASEWNKVEHTFTVMRKSQFYNIRIEPENGNGDYCLDNVSFKITKKVNKYEKPETTAAPEIYLSLNRETVKGNENATVTYNDDNTITINFKSQWAAISFYIPDNAEMYYSNYKSVELEYKLIGNNLSHSLYDKDHFYKYINDDSGKHPYWGQEIGMSNNYTTKSFNFGNSRDYVGDCITGLQIFCPNDKTIDNKSISPDNPITITIKSIKFIE